jgi:hypothetical protein
MSTLIVPVNAGDHVQGSSAAPVTLVQYAITSAPTVARRFRLSNTFKKRWVEICGSYFETFL